MELTRVRRYYPENMPYGDKCGYYQSEDGQDFYDSFSLFTGRFKLCIEPETGTVCGIAEDISALTPEGYSVVEVDELPEGCDESGRWKFDGAKVVDTRTREDALALKTGEINAWRNMQEQANVIFEAEGCQWDASLTSRTRIESAMAMVTSGTLPDGFFWTSADNEDIPATVALLTAIYKGMQQALVAQGFKIHERQRQMKQEVGQLTTVAEIEAYEVGWGEDGTTEE